jgi:HSP20 family protein
MAQWRRSIWHTLCFLARIVSGSLPVWIVLRMTGIGQLVPRCCAVGTKEFAMTLSRRPWRGTGFRPLDDLYREVDGLVQHFLGDEARANAQQEFVPQLNLSESDAGYEVTVDLPGMKPEDVSVEVHENQLTISGNRDAEKQEAGKTFHRLERRHGEFRRVVSLPVAVDDAKITASYEHGVLRITLPKTEKVKPTRITIQSAGS